MTAVGSGARIVGTLALLVGVASGGGAQAPADVPTLAAAEGALARAFEAGAAEATLCEVAASHGNCRALLHGAGVPPAAPPRIVCSSAYPGTDRYSPGLLLRIETKNGDGSTVTMDTLAIAVGGGDGARLMNPVYWVPAGVSVSQETGDSLEVSCAEVASAPSAPHSSVGWASVRKAHGRLPH
ncbi:hypothetical protein [Demequina aestuarii]|uniref:hypothetical protein n=1 Tax=Demequina aestuarii TaxID=327095 RepID=UPI000781FC50|nr:hypothetical protein [Demequina aestuarii]